MKIQGYNWINEHVVDPKKQASLDLKPGWTVKVHQRIKEGEKSRIQIFEGLVIKRSHGAEAGATFTVRKIASGVGVERTFPVYSPLVEKVEVVRKAKVRRSKLYYLRDKSAKATRRKIKTIALANTGDQTQPEAQVEAKPVEPEVEKEE